MGESLADVCRTFQDRLEEATEPREYLAHRLGPHHVGHLMGLFQLGLSPREWPGAGYFSDRITIPMWDDGDIVGFRAKSWRLGDTRPKGVPWPRGVQNMGDPLGITPHTIPVLERTRWCVLVEGEIDLLTLWGLGIPAVASCMSSLTQFAASRIAQYVDACVVWSDYDGAGNRFAGQRGGERSTGLLRAYGVSCACFHYPDSGVKDANDVYRRDGGVAVQEFVSECARQGGALVVLPFC